MLLPELKAEILKLPPGDRLALMAAIVASLRETEGSIPERSQAIHRMRGLLKTDEPPPTDQEVAAMLEERRLEKYLP
ncbi:hypothetical protein [Oscillatoria acuminata]|uniref:Addiction module component n=1 Tax=Oscillatoria acuminata PCC 6304 TaxID=56110 RepID=K9TT82_9CYAN|nr:hypothetical protein [Oscillatoria acuminata]AFY85219.1 hypothetical protein Oscil6304_5744 [Oscillatoria acuminata PCC 6304]